MSDYYSGILYSDSPTATFLAQEAAVNSTPFFKVFATIDSVRYDMTPFVARLGNIDSEMQIDPHNFGELIIADVALDVENGNKYFDISFAGVTTELADWATGFNEDCAALDDWTDSSAGAATFEISPAGQFHLLADGTNKAEAYRVHNLADDLTCEFSLKVDTFYNPYVYISNGTTEAELRISATTLSFLNAAGTEKSSILFTSATGAFHTYRMVFSKVKQNYDLWIDNILIVADVPAKKTSAEKRIYIGTEGTGGTNGEIHFDSITMAAGCYSPIKKSAFYNKTYLGSLWEIWYGFKYSSGDATVGELIKKSEMFLWDLESDSAKKISTIKLKSYIKDALEAKVGLPDSEGSPNPLIYVDSSLKTIAEDLLSTYAGLTAAQYSVDTIADNFDRASFENMSVAKAIAQLCVARGAVAFTKSDGKVYIKDINSVSSSPDLSLRYDTNMPSFNLKTSQETQTDKVIIHGPEFVTAGGNAINRADVWGVPYTIVVNGNPIPANGKIISYDVYESAAGDIKLKVFRPVTGTTLASVATGGTITTAGGYTYHTFTGSGTFTVPSYCGGNVEVLIVGGGGGGGGCSASNGCGGGGGAGGYYTGTLPFIGSITVTVGGAGTGGTADSGGDGGTSAFGIYSCAGGGGGGRGQTGNKNGRNGGSTGGGGYQGVKGATASAGYVGGDGMGSGSPYGGGGGGGAGAVGAAGATATGGAGLAPFGGATYYAGGGGGAREGTTPGAGGNGGGGAGGTNSNGVAGSANRGGGGGGGCGPSARTGGNGGTGVVIVRYLTTTLTFDYLVYIGGETTARTVKAGLNKDCNIEIPIEVQTGDLLGYFSATGGVERGGTDGLGIWYKSTDDVVTTQATSYYVWYDSLPHGTSLRAKIQVEPPVYAEEGTSSDEKHTRIIEADLLTDNTIAETVAKKYFDVFSALQYSVKITGIFLPSLDINEMVAAYTPNNSITPMSFRITKESMGKVGAACQFDAMATFFSKLWTTQADFQTGTLTNLTALSTGDLELSGTNTAGTSLLEFDAGVGNVAKWLAQAAVYDLNEIKSGQAADWTETDFASYTAISNVVISGGTVLLDTYSFIFSGDNFSSNNISPAGDARWIAVGAGMSVGGGYLTCATGNYTIGYVIHSFAETPPANSLYDTFDFYLTTTGLDANDSRRARVFQWNDNSYLEIYRAAGNNNVIGYHIVVNGVDSGMTGYSWYQKYGDLHYRLEITPSYTKFYIDAEGDGPQFKLKCTVNQNAPIAYIAMGCLTTAATAL